MKAASTIVFLVLWAPALAAGLGLRVGAGTDIVHQPGMPVVSVRAGPLWAAAWDANSAVGLAYDFGGQTGWRAELGALYAIHTDGDVGTHLNALVRGGYCWRRICAMLTHISHGGSLGIAEDEANSGLNFLTFEVRF